MGKCKNWKECLERERAQVLEETRNYPPGYEEKRDIVNIAKELLEKCETCNDKEEA